MRWILLALMFFPAFPQETDRASREREIEQLIQGIGESGQVLQIAVDVSERVDPTPLLAPGDPPLLAFRYFEGEAKHRFGKLDLVMDDAGH